MTKNDHSKRSLKAVLLACLVALAPLMLAGCAKDYLDPTQIGRFRPTPVVNVILDSLGVLEEPASAYADAQEPIPEDLIPVEEDYTFGTGDIVRIFIYELRRAGEIFALDFTVTESGHISIPDVGLVRATGMTENELESSIIELLSPDIIVNPSVTVTLLESQKLVYSVNGDGVRRPNRYPIPRHRDYRLTDAIASAGSIAQFNVSHIYVTRQITGKEGPTTPEAYVPSEGYQQPVPAVPADLPSYTTTPDSEPWNPQDVEIIPYIPEDTKAGEESEIMEVLTPYAKRKANRSLISSSKMIDADKLKKGSPVTTASEYSTKIEWVFKDGKYLPVRVSDQPEEATEEIVEDSSPYEEVKSYDPLRESNVARQKQIKSQASELDKYGWDMIGSGGYQTRVIKIPADALLGGDPRYNIIIKPGDAISVPVDVVGEFEVMGNTNYQGAVDMTGRPINLKQAIALAGGLGELAWPKKVEVIRRVGQNKEVIVMVDLDKIAKGEQPDFFIKPFDLINVGTHGSSRYLAALRTAFRAYYGFGFIYDRNFATRDFNNKPFDDISF